MLKRLGKKLKTAKEEDLFFCFPYPFPLLSLAFTIAMFEHTEL